MHNMCPFFSAEGTFAQQLHLLVMVLIMGYSFQQQITVGEGGAFWCHFPFPPPILQGSSIPLSPLTSQEFVEKIFIQLLTSRKWTASEAHSITAYESHPSLLERGASAPSNIQNSECITTLEICELQNLAKCLSDE